MLRLVRRSFSLLDMFSVSRQGNGFTLLYYFVLQVSFAARLEFSSNRKVEKSDSAVRRAVVTWYTTRPYYRVGNPNLNKFAIKSA